MQLLSISASTLLRSTERVRIPLYASISSVFTNIFMNWVLIYGNLGAPAMGVQGAAIATVLAAGMNVLIIYICCAATKYPLYFQIPGTFQMGESQGRRIFFKVLSYNM